MTDLFPLLRATAETVARELDPTRSPPLAGWCVEVAFMVRGVAGGTIRVAPLERGGHHYWNRLPDGSEVDLTSDQLGGNGIDPVFSVSHNAPLPDPVPAGALAFAALVHRKLATTRANPPQTDAP